jgi:MoxR-like ATPase
MIAKRIQALFAGRNKSIHEKGEEMEQPLPSPAAGENVCQPGPSATAKIPDMTVKERIQALLEGLNKGIYEKEEVISLALLSSIAGESIFLLGPPGTAKSLVARRLKYAYKDGSAFEYLMSRFSTPDEIFGPVSISKLKDEDKYERIVENYLPSATVVFLDEIWKAGPSIQNALLTVLNEKKFRNGEKEIDVPLKAIISASNELPAKDEGLEALWDRFLVRFLVVGIDDEGNFGKMISEDLLSGEDPVEPKDKITNEEYKEWDKAIKKIKIPKNVLQVIHFIRNYIAEHKKNEKKEKQIYISDRRWRKIVRLLRTSAFLNDRDEVDLMDCFLIQHCLWNEESEKDTVYQFVKDAIEKHGYTISFDFKTLKDELAKFNEEIKYETSFVKPVKRTELTEYTIQNKKYYRALIKSAFNYDADDLLEKDIIDKLTQSDNYVETKRWRNDLGDKDPVLIKRSSNKYKIYLKNNSYDQDKEYSFECTEKNKNEQLTKKPHPLVEKDWNGRVDVFLQHTNEWKEQIEARRKKDWKHLRTNAFVEPVKADIVESHVTETIKEIEKIETGIREIQNAYKKLKDEEVVIK